MSDADPRSLESSRLIPVPSAQIVRAFQDPERLARWWGPKGFRNTFHAFAFTPGGEWRLDMIGPDGAVYPNQWVVDQILPDRIVLRHLGPVHPFLLDVRLAEEPGGTRIHWHMTFESAEECARSQAYVPRCNQESFDRLEAELGRMAGEDAGGRELRLVRIIDAPPANVYRAWTDPALMVRWFTPPPWVTTHAELDVRPGGAQRIVMRGPDGTEMPHQGVYLEVVPGRRLVMTDAYTEAWQPSAKPFMTTVLTFEDLGGRTRYTARVLHWTAEDRQAHEDMGFREGWGVATDQLAALASTL